MLSGILAILGAIPGLGSIVTSIVGKLYDSKVAIATAQLGGARDIAVESLQTRVSGLAVIAGSTLLTWLVIAFAGPLVLYMWKTIGWDVVVGSFQGCVGKGAHGLECATFNTDPIRGEVAAWSNTIIISIFGSVTGFGVISAFKGAR